MWCRVFLRPIAAHLSKCPPLFSPWKLRTFSHWEFPRSIQSRDLIFYCLWLWLFGGICCLNTGAEVIHNYVSNYSMWLMQAVGLCWWCGLFDWGISINKDVAFRPDEQSGKKQMTNIETVCPLIVLMSPFCVNVVPPVNQDGYIVLIFVRNMYISFRLPYLHWHC